MVINHLKWDFKLKWISQWTEKTGYIYLFVGFLNKKFLSSCYYSKNFNRSLHKHQKKKTKCLHIFSRPKQRPFYLSNLDTRIKWSNNWILIIIAFGVFSRLRFLSRITTTATTTITNRSFNQTELSVRDLD